MNEFLKIIQERHSARVAFDPNHQIAKQDLEQILEAARWAPTAHNMQNFEIVVLDDKKQFEAIGKIRSQVSEAYRFLSPCVTNIQRIAFALRAIVFSQSFNTGFGRKQ